MLSRPFLYFEMCSTGDMSALQSALSRREISLCARDESGGTLLHFAAIAENFEICSFLLQLGANPDQRNFDGSTPFHMLVMISSAERSRLDCLRLLIEAQLDVTEEDLNWFYMLYSGPPEAAEIIFAYDTDFNPIPSRRNARTTALHMALRHLVRGSEQWYGMTRRLLRTKLNIHAQDRRRRSALDEVLKPFECPCNPDAAVATWLSILRDESIDIGAYLKQELTLDFREHHSSCNGCQRIPKGSHCVFGNRPFIHEEIMVVELDPPRVWLDSHFDPKSSASLVWDEFGHFTSYHYDACARLEFLWPFDFPKWSRVHYWRDDPKGNSHSLDLAFQGRFELARRRRDRRVEKKAQKLVRSQRHRGPRLIPGAWIA